MAQYEHPKWLPAGDRAVCIELADEISPEANARVHALDAELTRERLPGIVDLVPTYRSLLVYYDPSMLTLAKLQDHVRNLSACERVARPSPRVLHVPTRYGGEHGPDMDFVARHTGLSPDEIAAKHADVDYLIYMMGFNTGFPYLGGMSPRLAAPRLDTPRTQVPPGSVAVAQQQTGIYPVESPGGWRIIGRSPLRLFDPEREPPVAVGAGDYMRFVRIDDDGFLEIEERVQKGTYQVTMTEKA